MEKCRGIRGIPCAARAIPPKNNVKVPEAGVTGEPIFSSRSQLKVGVKVRVQQSTV